jgi:hypothetical protein
MTPPYPDAETLSHLKSDPEAANTLVCDAARHGDAEKLRMLLHHGANANGHFDPHKAAERQRDMRQHMLQYRQSQPDYLASIPESIRASFIEGLRQTEQQIDEQQSSAPSSHEIPLFQAAQSGSVECVRLLLDAGAKALARDNSQRTAMYRAASVEVIQELVRAGLPLEDADAYGWSPLADAVGGGEDAMPRLRALIEAGANVNATHDRGYTVFMSAVAAM